MWLQKISGFSAYRAETTPAEGHDQRVPTRTHIDALSGESVDYSPPLSKYQ
jgi:hypothetical protein